MVDNEKNDKVVDQTNDNTLNNGRSIEKQIGIVFVKTFSIILVLIFATIFYMCIFAPRLISNVSNELGMQKVSLYFAKVQYSRDKDINSLYTVINKSIAINSYNDISKYTKMMFEQPNYYDFITFIEAENMKRVAENASATDVVSLMISFANEDMYLKNKYVHSLVVNNQYDDANNFAVEDFNENNDSFTLGDRIHWCFSHIFTSETNFDFLNTEIKNNIEVITNNMYDIYINNEQNFDNLSTTEKFNFFVLGNALKKIYADLLNLENNVSFDSLSYDDIKNRIKSLN